jgi:hypothetical protein
MGGSKRRVRMTHKHIQSLRLEWYPIDANGYMRQAVDFSSDGAAELVRFMDNQIGTPARDQGQQIGEHTHGKPINEDAREGVAVRFQLYRALKVGQYRIKPRR